MTPKAYADSLRTNRLQDGLANGDSVTRAIHAAGYNSGSRVYHNTSEILGMTPSQYGNGAAGVRVRYALAPCSLGWLLVAATERGCRTVDGLGMLVHQGARQFASWTGVEAPREIMRAAAEACLAGS